MLTVRYALTRDEIWAWYMSTWVRGLWLFQALTLLMIVATCILLDIGGSATLSGVIGVITALVLIGLMAAWPQIRYRSEERVLTLAEDGLTYIRGRQSGQMPWARIKSVTSRDGAVWITGRSLSAFIIPTRAFASDSERAMALTTLKDLQANAR